MCAANISESELKHSKVVCVYLLPPVCSVLTVDCELIRVARASRDRALSDTSRTVHPRRTLLVESVPVNSRTKGHVILDVDNNSVAVVCLDGRSGVLPCKAEPQLKVSNGRGDEEG